MTNNTKEKFVKPEFCWDTSQKSPYLNNYGDDITKSYIGEKAFNELYEKEVRRDIRGQNANFFIRLKEKAKMYFYFILLVTRLVLRNLKKGQRATHFLGIGAKGTITFNSDNTIFADDLLFSKNKRYNIMLRHADATLLHNKSCVVRSASIKILDENNNSIIDFIMNSGTGVTFRNFREFLRIAPFINIGEPIEGYKNLISSNSFYSRAQIEFFRDGGSLTSYHRCVYYSHVKYHYIDKNGKIWICSFRIVPYDIIIKGFEEEGMLETYEEQENLVFHRKDEYVKNADKKFDFLQEELVKRIEKNDANYVLQVSARPYKKEYTPFHREIYCGSSHWDSKTYPYTTIAHISLNEAMSAEDTERSSYALSNIPKSFSFPYSYSIDDYNSVAWVRSRLYKILGLCRKVGHYIRAAKNMDINWNWKQKDTPDCLNHNEGFARLEKIKKHAALKNKS